ncbi:MAG: TorF family putative porin [Puniceicoccales bacterium]
MNKLSKILPAAAVFAAASFSSAIAQEEIVVEEEESFPIEGNIGVTSNYLFRGVTQTDSGAAVQGGLDYSHESGLYVGTWTSNVGFAGGTELDVYGGFAGEYEDFGYDVGIVGYLYPEKASGEDANFAEVYLSVAYDMFAAGLAYTVYSEIDDGAFAENDVYFFVGGGYDITDSVSIGLTLGYYAFDKDGDGDYFHGQIDLTKSTDLGDFTFSYSQAEESNVASDDPLFFVSWGLGF